MCGKEGEHAGYLNAGDNGEGYACASIFEAFGCRQLHGLVFGSMYSRGVATEHDGHRADDADDSGNTHAGQGKAYVALFDEIPTADTDDKDGSRHPSAKYGVEEL